MSDPVKQHRISRMYYDNFRNPGDKRAGRNQGLLRRRLTQRSTTSKTPVGTKNLNRWEHAFSIYEDGEYDYSVELLFSRYETVAAPVLKKLAKGRIVEGELSASISADEWQCLAELIMTLCTRTRPDRNTYEKMVEAGMFCGHEYRRAGIEIFSGASSQEIQNAYADFIGRPGIIRRTAQLHLLKCRFELIVFSRNMLITSDHPVYRGEHNGTVQTGIPVSPRRYLFFTGPAERLLDTKSKIPGFQKKVITPQQPSKVAAILNAQSAELAEEVYVHSGMRAQLNRWAPGWIPDEQGRYANPHRAYLVEEAFIIDPWE